jgi:Tol biopolymer transport system component
MAQALQSRSWRRDVGSGGWLRRLRPSSFTLVLLLATHGAWAVEPPPGLLFVGLQEGGWRLFIVGEAGKLQQLSTQSEPRAPAYSRDRHKVAYLSASGELREIDTRSGEDRLLLRPGAEEAYTQPAYGPRSDELYVITLKQGNSVDSDIAYVERQAARTRAVVTQRSAQFEPHISADGNALLYSHVVCTLDCGRIIQEIWQRDLLTGEAEQLTLLNGIARQPFQAPDGAIYFSSNSAGHYHIWRLARKGALPEQLSKGFVTDEAPVVDGAGSVFFIRRQREGVVLMRRSSEGRLETVALPRELKDLRDLRISP